MRYNNSDSNTNDYSHTSSDNLIKYTSRAATMTATTKAKTVKATRQGATSVTVTTTMSMIIAVVP